MGTLKTPSADELTELKRCGANQVVMQYFQSALESTKDSLVATPDIDQIRVLQGQAQTLRDILKLISL